MSPASSDSNNEETSLPNRALFAILAVEGAQTYKAQSLGQPEDFKMKEDKQTVFTRLQLLY